MKSMFFGLSMRQFFCAVIGVGFSVLLYFLLRPYFGVETLSWMCMLGAAPFIACGFIIYNGMTAEQFALVWIRSKFIKPIKVKFECDTLASSSRERTEWSNSRKQRLVISLDRLLRAIAPKTLLEWRKIREKNLQYGTTLYQSGA